MIETMTEATLGYTARIVNTLMLMPERSDAMESLLDSASVTYRRIEEALKVQDMPMIERVYSVEYRLKKFFEDKNIILTQDPSQDIPMVDAQKLEQFANDKTLMNCLRHL